MRGQIYVEVVGPKDVRRPYPLVLIHGNAQTPTNWMGAPDGRKGWADFFVEQGYIVYMVEQPMRGRSARHPSDGATRMFRVDDAGRLEHLHVQPAGGAGDGTHSPIGFWDWSR